LSTVGFPFFAAVIALGAAGCSKQSSPSSPGSAPAAQVETQEAPPAPVGDPQRLRDEIKIVEGVLSRLPSRGAGLYLLAHHYARLGDATKALALLKECVALDEGFDPSDAPAFASLKSDAEFRDIVEQVRRRYPPVHRANAAFTLPDKDLFPEGLAIDAEKRLFYMGSMHRHKIVQITLGGKVADFVKESAYSVGPVGGVHVDADHSIWCATDPDAKNPSELLHFDAQGKLLERYAAPGPGPHDLNDLVLRGQREIYVTDTYGNRVFVFDRKAKTFATVKVTAGSEGRTVIYPNGITLTDDCNVLYIADVLGAMRVDLRTQEVREVKPDAHDTLAGADGFYWYQGSLIGVQYGTGARRLMRWKLAADSVQVTSSEVLERGTEKVKDPTTGAIFEGKFYFMANTGIDNLDDDKIVDPTKLEPLHIAVVELK
jgi:sugar lactone lactonase YvrE